MITKVDLFAFEAAKSIQIEMFKSYLYKETIAKGMFDQLKQSMTTMPTNNCQLLVSTVNMAHSAYQPHSIALSVIAC